MRLLSALLPLILCSSVAFGQTPKEVEVINLPAVQDVFVTNPPVVPPVASVPRFQFVGFTTATYTGNLGGYFGAARKCQIDFPDSRICEIEEAAKTTHVPDDIPNISGFINFGIHRASPDNCVNWTREAGESALLDDSGNASPGSCIEPHPIACCALVP